MLWFFLFVCFFHKRRQSLVSNRRPSLAPAGEAQTVCGKECSEGQPMEAERDDICSSLRIAWGTEVLTHPFLVGALEERKTPPASWKYPDSADAYQSKLVPLFLGQAF